LNDKSLGASCTDDDQCMSGLCSTYTPRTCVCSSDSDCPSGQQCKKPLFNKNYCD
jgi:Cys-rich repeat protein